MSRVAKNPIVLPKGVDATISGDVITIASGVEAYGTIWANELASVGSVGTAV